jgi:hypothetical protein
MRFSLSIISMYVIHSFTEATLNEAHSAQTSVISHQFIKVFLWRNARTLKFVTKL